MTEETTQEKEVSIDDVIPVVMEHEQRINALEALFNNHEHKANGDIILRRNPQ